MTIFTAALFANALSLQDCLIMVMLLHCLVRLSLSDWSRRRAPPSYAALSLADLASHCLVWAAVSLDDEFLPQVLAPCLTAWLLFTLATLGCIMHAHVSLGPKVTTCLSLH